MYYSSNAEEELGFDAFIAPDDFDRTAQPVDIYEVFKREYALSQRARYIYYYSDGNYPLTLTPTTDEYYRYGHRNGGVDVIYDVPLSSEGGVATTIWGASGNTSGGDESGFTHRWVVVYRVSTAKFVITVSISRMLWLYCGDKVSEINSPRWAVSGGLNLKWIHTSNLNSITGIFNQAFAYNPSCPLQDRVTFPETVTQISSWAFFEVGTLIKITLPQIKNVSISHDLFWNPFRPASARIEFNFGASTSLGEDDAQRNSYSNLSVISVSQHNTAYASFDGCDIIYTKDLTTIHWLAPKTVRGLYLPDQLPQSQIDALGTKFNLQQLQNHQLYIGTQITDLTNLYLANKSFVTIEVGSGNTAFSVDGNILYNTTKTQLIKAGTYNTGDLIIPNTVTEILAGSFLRCSGYTGNLTIPSSVTSIASGAFSGLTNMTSLTLPVGFDTAIYNNFGFANFSADSLNTAILSLANGTVGAPKYFTISKTSLDALNIAYPNAVSDAAARYINVVSMVMDGLKLWLDASNPLSYPGTGTTWYDLSGNANNGTMVNGVTYSTANGGVMSFDGVNDYVSGPIFAGLGSSNRTINIWVNILSLKTAGPGRILTLSADNSSIDAPAITIGYRTTQSSMEIGFGGSPYNGYSTGNSFSLNTWMNIVAVISGNNMTLYKDNIIIGTVINTGSVGQNPILQVGRYNNHYGQYANIKLNDTLIYNRALTAEEVNQIFQATRNKYGI